MTDPILEAIATYQAEMARYSVLCTYETTSEECDALADQTFAPQLAALENWSQPALTKAGAMRALELALDEGKQYVASELVPAMLKAALGYFKHQERAERTKKRATA